jgi:hypothetical protein
MGVLKVGVTKRTVNENFGFLKNLHYYNCSGLLYANK